MKGGVGSRGGFFAGAVGGLAIGLLLIGVVSFLPQSNNSTLPHGGPAKSGAEAIFAATSMTTTTTGCSSCGPSTSHSSAQSAPQSAAVNAPPAGAAGAAGASSSTTYSGSSASQFQGSAPVLTTQAGASNGGPQAQMPGSLLTVLPGESVGSLIATLSPLLIGLLVAALIYGAYTRRQDASS